MSPGTPDTGPDRDADPASRFSDAMDTRPASTRERDLRRYGAPRRHTQLIWIAIAVVGLVLFAVLMRAVMEKTKWTAGATATHVHVVTFEHPNA